MCISYFVCFLVQFLLEHVDVVVVLNTYTTTTTATNNNTNHTKYALLLLERVDVVVVLFVQSIKFLSIAESWVF